MRVRVRVSGGGRGGRRVWVGGEGGEGVFRIGVGV